MKYAVVVLQIVHIQIVHMQSACRLGKYHVLCRFVKCKHLLIYSIFSVFIPKNSHTITISKIKNSSVIFAKIKYFEQRACYIFCPKDKFPTCMHCYELTVQSAQADIFVNRKPQRNLLSWFLKFHHYSQGQIHQIHKTCK